MWRVIDNETGEEVVSFNTPYFAQREALILSAHAIAKGKVANYSVRPVLFIPYTLDELRLPIAVLAILACVGHVLEEDL